ncbi:MAG: nitronate monooxygenase [Bacteriovorax sp.]|nr:nitronate monooxygenase [Bacteriovorax sp.]
MNKLTKLFGIDYPIIQGGMVWVSGGKLAAAVSRAGGLGIVGAGSMQPELLQRHITKAQSLTSKPIAVNIPLLYEKAHEQIDMALSLGIKIFFTSAGSPKKFTSYLKDHAVTVVHVVSTPEQAKSSEEAGVDAVVAEGFEAGGHNGRDEITTMTLIPQVRDLIKIPLIAAGGIADGRAMLAALSLGADGVQMGTRFLMTRESSAHEDFKNLLLQATPSSTKTLMKATVPVRLFSNKFAEEILQIEQSFHGENLKQKLKDHLGKYRAQHGMLEGDLINGELEVGQVIALIKNIPSVEEVFIELIRDYQQAYKNLPLHL